MNGFQFGDTFTMTKTLKVNLSAVLVTVAVVCAAVAAMYALSTTPEDRKRNRFRLKGNECVC